MESEFYLQARREWDERYGDLVLGKRNWQITSIHWPTFEAAVMRRGPNGVA
jgi:type IV secretory pathway TrbF-like protein